MSSNLNFLKGEGVLISRCDANGGKNKNRKSIRNIAVTLLAFLVMGISESWGQNDRYWSGVSPSSDNIDQGANWFGGVNPSSGDNLYFNNSASARKWPYSNYGAGSYFGNIIVYTGSGGIRWRGNRTYAYKYENNNDGSLFEIEGEIANRGSANFEINPFGSGGISILSQSRVTIQDGMTLNIYGSNTLSIACVIDESNGSGKINLNSGHSPTVTLTGACTYSGLTTISGGILRLNRSGGTTIPNTNNITVSGGSLRISSNQELNNLTVSSGTLIIDAGVTLTINGTFTGGGTIQNNGSLILKGNSTFPGASSTVSSMTNLDINRAAGVTLDKDFTITGTLTFTAGKLDLNGNTLTLSADASISGGSSSSYIITSGTGASGKVSKSFTNNSAFTFPIGTSSSYMPVTLTNANAQTFDVKATSPAARDGVVGSGNSFSATQIASIVNGLWNINRSAGSGTVTVQLNWPAALEGATFSAASNAEFGISRRNGSTWEAPTQTSADNSTNTASSTFSSFSPFIIARTDVSLPVTFTSLTGSIRNGRAQLSWNIADEVNVDHYEVEESADGRRFQALTQVDAASRSSYMATDAQLNLGANYYRVKAVDIDGKLTYSKIIRLDNSAVDNNIRVYPNPSQGELTLGLNFAAGNYLIRVINAIGQTVHQQPLTHEGGSRSLPLSLPKLNTGIYQVEVRGGMQKYVKSVRIE